MLELYRSLADFALTEFGDLVTSSRMVGGTSADPNKLRLIITDGSFLDIWLSEDDDYAYHWEHGRQSGKIYRWDNAPHHPEVSTFPKHFHDGDETTITGAELSADPRSALRDVLDFIRRRLAK